MQMRIRFWRIIATTLVSMLLWNAQVQELLRAMVRLNESIKHFTAESEHVK
jgi:hypothetical protein